MNETVGKLYTDLPLELTVSVGRARPLIKDLIEAQKGTVLPLDARVDDPVTIYLGNKLVATGELVEMDGDQRGNLAVKLTTVSGLTESQNR
ncbi:MULTISPECIES: FliM/FliN family flagellar motor switch protein [Halocynthiibacter]|uniref:Flagellar motor switch protein FliN n=1 Tax=Halocynthiibacter halioticoli TaxID=2986804 RepID=A0AAE3IVW3_9RHOB|nr:MULTISPECIES: FliM/FliN family flagellar motor switch protein [Halocynthiibacter]MCV6823090.1 FliM/FliN family flagellar motor switch protein [Halocynthiibacter halioticoli]MCW4056091.1 FliM/FliN family flagellar motor switch protein [Halocynthiibacter sp. SDUM655004]